MGLDIFVLFSSKTDSRLSSLDLSVQVNADNAQGATLTLSIIIIVGYLVYYSYRAFIAKSALNVDSWNTLPVGKHSLGLMQT